MSAAEREELQQYLNSHGIEAKLNELLNKLVGETPPEPFAWLAEQLAASAPAPSVTWPSPQTAAADPCMPSLARQWDAVLTFQGRAGAAGAPAASASAPAPAAASKKAAAAAPAAAAAAAEGGGGGSKDKDAKKAAKAEEKRKKEEEKERKRKEREEMERKKLEGPDVPSVTLENFMEHPFGQLNIQSHCTTPRVWSDVGDLTAARKGETVWLRVRLHNSRKQSAKLGFLVLRQRLATVQAVVQGKDLAAFACSLPKESVLDVCAEVTVPPEPVVSCTQSAVELNVTRAYCITKAAVRLPLQVEDAARSEKEVVEQKLPRVAQDTRLDNRVIDLRTAANQGILRMQSEVCALFREFLLERGFTEIHSPKMIATASEGGADVFRLNYFDRYAYLAQSPQLYKQMSLMADMGKVFEIGPVFRSEKSFTHRHMTEFVGLDLEMTFHDDYHEVLEVLEGLFLHIFDGLNTRCAKEIEAVRAQYPFANLQYPKPALRLTYPEAVKLLREHGPAIGAEQQVKLEAAMAAAKAAGDDETARDLENQLKDMKAHLATVPTHGDDEDISTKDEKLLGAVMHRTKGTDFYVIDKFPACLRPFYTMKDPDDPKWSNSYDIFIRGEEVTSGAQRIHDPDLLLKNAESLGVDLGPIADYVNSFNYGAFPHAGGGIGLERVVMLFLGLANIRQSSMFPRDPSRLTP